VTSAFVTFFLRDHHVDRYIHAFPSSISARLLTDSLSDAMESLYSAPQEILLCSDYLNACACAFKCHCIVLGRPTRVPSSDVSRPA
jgi:hypothetical protein